MDPVQKALWYVESHSREPVTLDSIARSCRVSAFHLTRAFGATTGLSLMRYVRARRLTEAARQLAEGATDILAVALDAGYGSHEAFTRAFRDQFGLTPEQVRSQAHTDNLLLVEPITMNATPSTELEPPRFENFRPILFAGLVERYNCQSPAGIADQWQRFGPHIGRIPGQVGPIAYGVIYNFDSEGNFDYMCAVEVGGPSALPNGLSNLHVPVRKYAIFSHRGHIAGIRGTMSAIWSQWLPQSGHKALEGPTLERYGPEFNPMTGMGGLEIWVPIQE
jgi:AraC family transcriptional regulator